MFTIGWNLTSTKIRILIPCPEKKVSKAFSGNEYSIYADDNYDNLWSAGYNGEGSCGVGKKTRASLTKLTPITYFKKNGIKIERVYVSPSG